MHVQPGVAAGSPGPARRYRLAGRLLRVVLVFVLLGSALVQVLVPLQAAMVGTTYPEVQYLVVPYSVAAILFIGCVQVALLVVWWLLALVDRGAIFSGGALRGVDIITGCAVVATVLSAVVLAHMLRFVPGGGGPAIYLMLACMTGGLACVLLMIVVRGVLEGAGRAAAAR